MIASGAARNSDVTSPPSSCVSMRGDSRILITPKAKGPSRVLVAMPAPGSINRSGAGISPTHEKCSPVRERH